MNGYNSFLAVCQAIAFAHSRNVLHRDLKPENVALGNFGEVIVLDWGLAKHIDDSEWHTGMGDQENPNQSSIIDRTMAGQVMGTPFYMSPEQAAGRIDSIDVRTDVYGLGATLFTILTGYAPHESSQGKIAPNLCGAELYAAIVENPTPRVAMANPKVPVELDAICARAMARSPAARYQSASDLANDIQCWMAGESVSAYQEKWRTGISRWVKQRTLPQWCLAMLVVVAVVAGSVTFSVRQSQFNADRAMMKTLQLDSKSLSVNLVTAIEKATRNIRFMSQIPPIQAIARIYAPQQTQVTEQGNTTSPREDEETWRARLDTIFKGLVMANFEYVSVSYLALANDDEQQGIHEIVRVERNRTDRAFIRSVPQSQLSGQSYCRTTLAISGLRAGDVYIADVIAPKIMNVNAVASDTRIDPAPLTMDLAVPVFDEQTGLLFGAVVLTIDIESLMTERIYESDAEHILLANHEGHALASFHPRAGVQSRCAPPSTFSLPEAFLSGPATDHAHFPDKNYPNGFFAVKVQFDRAHPERTVVLVFEGALMEAHY